MYEERKYRNLFKGNGLQFFDVCICETDLRIGAHRNLYDTALETVRKYRKQIELYIMQYPDFLTSLKPLSPQPGASFIIERMCNASRQADVGPMASVAGAISEMVGRHLLNFSDEVIVENGGDIFVKTNKLRRVGIYAGNSPLNQKIGLEIDPAKTPLGICTSSGTVGHSLSFGRADAAVVVSPDTFLADAVATAACNMVKTPGHIENALEFASRIKGVEGIVVIMDDKVGAWGDVKLVSI
ncbi:MAG: UPF0280 family protein [Acetivibrionales bacterium]|jgi:ApbE superfamily uncharacterized protein (UPF0280 family)